MSNVELIAKALAEIIISDSRKILQNHITFVSFAKRLESCLVEQLTEEKALRDKIEKELTL